VHGIANTATLVVGPASATDNSVAVYDGTTGKLLKDGTGTVTAGKFSPTATTMAGNGMYLPAANTVAFSTASVERLRVAADGNVGIGLVPALRNNTRLQIVDGIGFPATQVASTDANTLDDYEEGTWTPEYEPATGSFASITYNIQNGIYTKIGRVVAISCLIRTSDIDVTGASGALRIKNLPFTSLLVADRTGTGSPGVIENFGAALTLRPTVVENNTIIIFYKNATNAGLASTAITDMATGAGNKNYLGFTAVYITA
jgi:hypothetical protein